MNMSACGRDIDVVVVFLVVLQQCRNWGKKKVQLLSVILLPIKKKRHIQKNGKQIQRMCARVRSKVLLTTI